MLNSPQEASRVAHRAGKLVPEELDDIYEAQITKVPNLQAIGCAEFFYRYRNEVPKEALEMGIELMRYCVLSQFWQLDTGPGQARIEYMTKALGGKAPKGGWPKDEEAPAVMRQTGLSDPIPDAPDEDADVAPESTGVAKPGE